MAIGNKLAFHIWWGYDKYLDQNFMKMKFYLHIHRIASTKTSNYVPWSNGLQTNISIKSLDFKPGY